MAPLKTMLNGEGTSEKKEKKIIPSRWAPTSYKWIYGAPTSRVATAVPNLLSAIYRGDNKPI